jgi:hypothetical protein
VGFVVISICPEALVCARHDTPHTAMIFFMCRNRGASEALISSPTGSYIQRVNTTGGLAPATCDPAVDKDQLKGSLHRRLLLLEGNRRRLIDRVGLTNGRSRRVRKRPFVSRRRVLRRLSCI